MSTEDKNNEQDAPKSYTQADVDKMMADKDGETAGLKANHDKLLGEKKEARRIADESALDAQNLKEQNALKSGEFESLSKMQKERHDLEIESLTGKLKASDDLILGGNKKIAVTSALDLFTEDARFLAKDKLSGMIESVFDESGKPAIKYKDSNGNLLGYNELGKDKLQESLNASPDFQKYLKGIDMNGGGSRSEGNSGGATNKKLNKTELSQLANTDPVKYQNYINSQGN